MAGQSVAGARVAVPPKGCVCTGNEPLAKVAMRSLGQLAHHPAAKVALVACGGLGVLHNLARQTSTAHEAHEAKRAEEGLVGDGLGGLGLAL